MNVYFVMPENTSFGFYVCILPFIYTSNCKVLSFQYTSLRLNADLLAFQIVPMEFLRGTGLMIAFTGFRFHPVVPFQNCTNNYSLLSASTASFFDAILAGI